MPIQSSDIKFVKSEIMSDDPEAGGRITGNVILDNVENSVFDDIPQLSKEIGDFESRKIYWTVDQNGSDSLLGVNILLASDSADPGISAVIYSDGSWSSRRTEYQELFESYYGVGLLIYGYLFGNHQTGRLEIQLLQDLPAAIPDGNTSIALIYHESEQDEHIQYVRVTEIESYEQAFPLTESVTVTKRVVTLSLIDPLDFDYPGLAPMVGMPNNQEVILRSVSPVQQAQLCGVVPVTGTIAASDSTIQVDTVFAPVVPVAQSETILASLPAVPQIAPYIQSGAVASISVTANDTDAAYLLQCVLPASVSVTGTDTLTDSGAGVLTGAVVTATINYATGAIAFSQSGSWTITATPAVRPAMYVFQSATIVTLENRSGSFSQILDPIPARAAVSVQYRTGGNWYELLADGDGVLRGAPGAGTGNVSEVTGNVAGTFGALPDIGSPIIISWGIAAGYTQRWTAIDIAPPTVVRTLTYPGVVPGTVTWTWTAGDAKTATESGGVIAGDAIGNIGYADGVFRLVPDIFPDLPFSLTVEYDSSTATAIEMTPVVTDHVASFTIENAPLAARRQIVRWRVNYPVGYYHIATQAELVAYDDGVDGWVDEFGEAVAGAINLTTGVATLTVEPLKTWKVFNKTTRNYEDAEGYATFVSGSMEISYVQSGATPTARSENFTISSVAIDLTPTTGEPVTPGCVRFELAGHRYFDNGLGAILRDANYVTGQATTAGSIVYSGATGGVCTLTNVIGGSNTFTLESLITSRLTPLIDALYGRTASSPLRPASFNVAANTEDGAVHTAESDINGDIDDGIITGTIQNAIGYYSLAFSSDVVPSTVRYSAVAYRQIGLPSDIIGVNLARLPSDGRQQIIRKDGHIVIHHTGELELPNPVSPNSEHDALRGLLSRVRLLDQAGLVVPADQYSADLDTGILTMAANLSLEGFTQPLIYQHVIEHGTLVTEVDVGGAVQLVTPSIHNFPSGSKVSNTLLIGTRRARFDSFHAGQTWNNVWSNTLQGSGISAQFNYSAYPPILTNKGTITERWALVFLTSSSFQCYGEYSGLIGSGTINAPFAIANPYFGGYYFSLNELGWGEGGFSAGNYVRFNTYGIGGPLIVCRIIQPGTAANAADLIDIWVRSDINQ